MRPSSRAIYCPTWWFHNFHIFNFIWSRISLFLNTLLFQPPESLSTIKLPSHYCNIQTVSISSISPLLTLLTFQRSNIRWLINIPQCYLMTQCTITNIVKFSLHIASIIHPSMSWPIYPNCNQVRDFLWTLTSEFGPRIGDLYHVFSSFLHTSAFSYKQTPYWSPIYSNELLI